MDHSEKRHPKRNKTTSLKISKAMDEGLSILLEEIELAIEWNRPGILLTVQKSNPAKSKAETMLEKKLKKISQKVMHVRLDDESPDFPRLLSQSPAQEDLIYFFSHLEPREGDRKDVYRALNLYRETFIEKRVRAVFWLSEVEAADMVRFAPDFWAFRHRVVEFAPQRGPRKKFLP